MQSLNQQPTPRAYNPTTMSDIEVTKKACDELNARFKGKEGFNGLTCDDIDGGVTITVHRVGFPVSTFGWQQQCNDVERALRISAPHTDLMIVVV